MDLDERRRRQDVYVLYFLFAGLLLTAVLSPLLLFLAIGANLRRKKFAGTPYEHHLIWIIDTFLLLVGGVMLMAPFDNGSTSQQLILAATLVLVLYRLGKGVVYLKGNRPLRARAIF